MCKKAISELDFNQFANAKEALKLALQAVQSVKKWNVFVYVVVDLIFIEFSIIYKY